MFGKALLTVVAILNTSEAFANYKYGIEVKDENISSPCNRLDVYPTEHFLDMSDLTFEKLENGSIIVNGTAVWIKDLGFDKVRENSVSMQIFQKRRGEWVNTIYDLHRADVCTSLFNPTEPWHIYLKSVPQKYKKCPFFKGQKFVFHILSDMEIVISIPRLEGEYWINFLIHFKGIDEFLCFNTFVDLYRI